MVLAGGDRNRLQLFSDVFQKYFKALRGKPEISEDDGGNPEKACFLHSAKFTIFTDALAANRKSVCPGGAAKSKSAVLNAIPDL